ncbi:MAG: ankyrin repeat domain-containing protein [Pseudomonadota bacterium]|nr:ankyrin repeat domain-containing protein [Pseudomonadota bacterium]
MYIFSDNDIFVMVKIIGGTSSGSKDSLKSTISLDNTCQTFAELKFFFKHIITELNYTDKYLDLERSYLEQFQPEDNIKSLEKNAEQKRIIKIYLDVVMNLMENIQVDNLDSAVLNSSFLNELVSDINSIILDSQTKRDRYIQAVNSVFAVNHESFKKDGHYGVRESVLGKSLREAFVLLGKPQKYNHNCKELSAKLRPRENLLKSVSFSESAQRIKDAWLACDYSEELWESYFKIKLAEKISFLEKDKKSKTYSELELLQIFKHEPIIDSLNNFISDTHEIRSIDTIDDTLAEIKQAWLSCGFDMQMWENQALPAMNYRKALLDEEYSKSQIIGALDLVWEIIFPPSEQNDMFQNILSTDYKKIENEVRKSEGEIKADKISVLTQFCLGIINIYLKDNYKFATNIGLLLDDDEKLSQELATIVKSRLERKEDVLEGIFYFIEKLDLKIPEISSTEPAETGINSYSEILNIDDNSYRKLVLSKEDKKIIREKTVLEYTTIKKSDHFDEFFFAPDNIDSPFFSYGGAITCELSYLTRALIKSVGISAPTIIDEISQQEQKLKQTRIKYSNELPYQDINIYNKINTICDDISDRIDSIAELNSTKAVNTVLDLVEFLYTFSTTSAIIDADSSHHEQNQDENIRNKLFNLVEKIIKKLDPCLLDINWNNTTPLIWAINNNLRNDIIDIILKKSNNVNKKDSRGQNALAVAVERGKVNIVEKLLLSPEINYADVSGSWDISPIHISGSWNISPIHNAIVNNQNEIFDILLKKYLEDKNDDIFSVNTHNFNLLCIAIEAKNKHAIMALAKYEKFYITGENSTYNKPLQLAASQPDVSITVTLVQSIENIIKEKYAQELSIEKILNYEGDNNETPLSYACNHGLYEQVEFLLKMGASLNREDMSGNTPLINLINRIPKSSISKRLFENFEDHNLSYINCFLIMLQSLYDNNNLNLINKHNKIGHTALSTAINSGNMQIVLDLLGAGANPEIVCKHEGKFEFTMIEYIFLLVPKLNSLEVGDEDLLNMTTPYENWGYYNMLLNAAIGANIKTDKYDDRGNSYLHKITGLFSGNKKDNDNYEKFITTLCNSNIDITKRNDDGLTCIECALEVGDEAFLSVITQKVGINKILSGEMVNLKKYSYKLASWYLGLMSTSYPVDRSITEKLCEHLPKKYANNILNIACLMGNYDFVEIALSKGANINNKEYICKPIFHALKSNNIELVNILYDKCKNELDSEESSFLLCTALDSNLNDVYTKLIADKGCFDHQNIDGEIPLHIAAVFRKIEVMQEILANTSDEKINIKNRHGNSPLLECAVSYQTYDLHDKLKHFIESPKVDLTLTNNDNSNVLHCLAGRMWLEHALNENKLAEIVKAICEKGISIDAKNNYGKTPRDIATEKGNSVMLTVLDNIATNDPDNSCAIM